MKVNNPVGKLISFNQSTGLIKYVGPLEGAIENEIWYGIEWKDPSRGKHDGSYKGKRYFTTRHPTGGSFVKPNKVDFGVSIWEAIEDKYFKDETALRNHNETDKNEDSLLYNNFDAKERGMKINCISIAQSKISSTHGVDKINEHFPKLIEIELEDNLFYSWSQIFDILDQVKTLKIINISDNILEYDENDQRTYENITGLIINKMNYDWNNVCRILKHFPNVIELKTCFNSITKIDNIDIPCLDKLTILDLESNKIIEWKNLLKLGEFKNLQVLYANDIQLSEIVFDDCDFNYKTKYFPNLKILALNDNRINNWDSINQLHKLKSLEELRLKSNPLCETEKSETFRQMIIAKIGNLRVVNRTQIERKDRIGDERKMAEIDYLKKFAKKWYELKESIESAKTEDEKKKAQYQLDRFHLEHPRYMAIVKIYGATEKSETEVKIDTLKSSLISVKILNEVSGKIVERKIPSTIEIKRLKVIIKNLFKANFMNEEMKLFYTTIKKPSEEYELDNDYRVLNFYSIDNGDTIIARL
ncbi:unnamed protein product [Brachionus calyciflorus]|uniref:Tubulin-specific chaperone E n=1 Tax=Brachionus calyciflorus TaxID=104777 RepID=A0A813YLE0_9BILA|nr:unnamed protein product [Brachionus calyciflorus]